MLLYEKKKHTFEFEIKIVNNYFNNEGGYNFLSKKYNVDTTQVRAWITQYYQFGYEGLSKSMTYTHYSGEFKRAVLQYRQENQLSYRETAEYFTFSRCNHFYHVLIARTFCISTASRIIIECYIVPTILFCDFYNE